MVSIQETAYPRLRSNCSKKELDEVYTPTAAELAWISQFARSPISKLGLIVSLKISQRLGYFISIADIPTNIVEHIAQSVGISSISPSELKAYSLSGTCKRHHSQIRNYKNFRFFDISAKQLMLEAMSQSALTKDDPADLINIAIEKLVR